MMNTLTVERGTQERPVSGNQAKVAYVDPEGAAGRVIVTRGSLVLYGGEELVIPGQPIAITDPDTGDHIGQLQTAKAWLRAIHVQARMTLCEITRLIEPVVVGDVVIRADTWRRLTGGGEAGSHER